MLALVLYSIAAAVTADCSADGSSARPRAEISPTLHSSATAPADAQGGRDFRRITRCPGSWISEAHDTYYIYCPDILITYRDFLVNYATMETNERRIIDFFKEQLRHSGYRVIRDDQTSSAGRTTWNVDFRVPNAPLMCRANPSDTSEHDAYLGEVRLTVERSASAPTSVQVEVLLSLRADGPF